MARMRCGTTKTVHPTGLDSHAPTGPRGSSYLAWTQRYPPRLSPCPARLTRDRRSQRRHSFWTATGNVRECSPQLLLRHEVRNLRGTTPSSWLIGDVSSCRLLPEPLKDDPVWGSWASASPTTTSRHTRVGPAEVLLAFRQAVSGSCVSYSSPSPSLP